MRKPRALRPGDRIAIVAPASPFSRDAFERGVAELRHLGFEPAFDDHVYDRHGYVAGEVHTRVDALQAAWRDESVAAIMVARGGYGSVQMLPWLDWELARRVCKPLVGYSDITSLLSMLTVHCGLVAFYGPSVAGCLGRGVEHYDRATFLRALTVTEPLGPIASPTLQAVKPGEAAGELHGGTLTQLVSSLGTPFAFDPPQGCILLIDEVGERPYRLDRMLTQLSQAGVIGKAAAIVFNELPGCDEPGGKPSARGTIADALRDFPGPILFGLQTGHTDAPALTLPLGVRARVVATGSPAVVIEETAVEP
jgi:muramoyltetrapeptide carboxypeptidase